MADLKHPIGPVETLARLCIQSNRYRDDADFREATDAVLGKPMYDAASEMLDALRLHVEFEAIPQDRGGKNGPKGRAWTAFIAARDAAIAKAEGGNNAG
ncbi:MAG: hypothetical protein JJ864_08700 [Rhizobiaceae bacterium]|nr:hypothetical protein [Rhizobiaceae bacterium]